MIAARLVAAESPALARRAAQQDYGAVDVFDVRLEPRRRRLDAGAGLHLYRVWYDAPCPHCGGRHEDDERDCQLVRRGDLAAELEPRGGLLER